MQCIGQPKANLGGDKLCVNDREVSMSEYDVMSLMVERRQELISIVQWWASISIGIIAGSQILERYLNIVLLCVLIFFYLFFSLVSFNFTASITAQLLAGFTDLSNMGATSAQAQTMLEQHRNGSISENLFYARFALGAVVLITCSYPIWVYNKSHAKST